MNALILCCFVFALSSLVSATAETNWMNICLRDTTITRDSERVTAFVNINSINGTDSRTCLIDENIDCKTLAYVFDNVHSLNIACLQIILKQTDIIHFLPSGSPPLSNLSLYMVSEEGSAQITCPNNVENVTTSWSMQNAEVAIFKSLIFSNCNKRLALVNVSNVYFQDVTFR